MKIADLLFGRKIHKETDADLKDKVAKGIARFLLKTQSGLAAMMNDKTKNISPGTMKIILISFCLFCGGFSLYLIGDAVLKPERKQWIYKADPVSIPMHYEQNGDEGLRSREYVDRETFRQIVEFERYMDSLRRTAPGLHLYDSILLARPRLMDSIIMLKEIYQYQQK